jgi:hypothetical protein
MAEVEVRSMVVVSNSNEKKPIISSAYWPPKAGGDARCAL